MDNPEYTLLKELRGRYRNKYKFLNISLGRNGSRGTHSNYDLTMTWDKKPPQIRIILIENGDKLRVRLAKQLTQRQDGDSVTLASPHMLVRLDEIVKYSVLTYIKSERERNIITSNSRTRQIIDLKHQIERLNTDARRMAGIIEIIGGKS
jgi:hypothetical protein